MKKPSVTKIIEDACIKFCTDYCKYQKEFDGVEDDEEYDKKIDEFCGGCPLLELH